MKKYYDVLELKDGASRVDIENAYKRLSIELNPANNDNQDFFVEEFALLQEAYTALTTTEPDFQVEIENPQASGFLDLFDDSDNLLSILKMFRESTDLKKVEIIESLEAFKSSNLTYQEALEILYKKEGVNVVKSYKDKLSKSNKRSAQNSINPSNANSNNPSRPTKIPPKKSKNETKSSKKKIYVLLLSFISLGASYLFFLNKVSNFESLIPAIEQSEIISMESEKNKCELKFRKDFPKLKSYFKNSNSNVDGELNFDDAIVKRDTIINFLFFSNKLKFNSLDSNYFKCAYYHEINRYEKKYNKEFLNWFNKTRKKHNIKIDKLDNLIQKVKDNPLNASFPFKDIKSDIDKNCTKCISGYISSVDLDEISTNDFDSFVKSYLKTDLLARNFSAQSFIDFIDDLEKHEGDMSKSLKKAFSKKASKNNPNAITLWGSDGNSPKKYPFLYSKQTQYKFKDSNILGEISYSLENQYYDKSVLDKLVGDLYKTNSLSTGAQPYSYCYGRNPYCSIPNGYAECSFINVQASSSSDVVVVIKKNNKVFSHAYIKAGGSYKFKIGNGSFQTFFYYGKGWNPNKYIKKSECGEIIGGFVTNESLDKSDKISLFHSSMSYTLYNVENGNFSPKPSNKNEAF